MRILLEGIEAAIKLRPLFIGKRQRFRVLDDAVPDSLDNANTLGDGKFERTSSIVISFMASI